MADKRILDLTRLEEAFEDDAAGIAELLEMALETGAKHRRALADAIAEGDAPAVARAAHGIKGSAGNIGAGEVMQAAAALEQRARAGDLGDADAGAAAVADAYARLGEAVEAFKATLP